MAIFTGWGRMLSPLTFHERELSMNLQPDSLGSTIADFDRRLRTLESAGRVGLSRVRAAWNTAAAPVAVFDAWYTGPAGAAWADDQGDSGTGYPALTLRTGRRALVLAQAFAENIANDPTFKTFGWSLGIGIDGASPPSGQADRYQTHGPTSEGNNYLTLVHIFTQLEPGEHTFYLSTNWQANNPAAVNIPQLSSNNSAFLAVLPLDL